MVQQVVRQQALVKSEPGSGLSIRKQECSLTTTQMKFLKRYETAEKLMATFIPEQQTNFARYPERCFGGNSPTLADVRNIWGGNYSNYWLENQLRDLNEYVGCSKKMDILQIEDTARVIIADSFFLKLSEVMLFFARLKAGRYGKFYGSVDPMTITTALQKFKDERITELGKIEEAKKKEIRETRDTTDTMSYAEWQELKWLFNMGYERDPITGCVI